VHVLPSLQDRDRAAVRVRDSRSLENNNWVRNPLSLVFRVLGLRNPRKKEKMKVFDWVFDNQERKRMIRSEVRTL